MAVLKITIPDTHVDEARAAFAARAGWRETIQDAAGQEIPNPQTEGEAARRNVAELLVEHVTAYMRRKRKVESDAAIDAEIDAVKAQAAGKIQVEFEE